MVYTTEDFLQILDSVDKRYRSTFVIRPDIVIFTRCADFQRQNITEESFRVSDGKDYGRFDEVIATHHPKSVMIIPECCSPYEPWYTRLVSHTHTEVEWYFTDPRGAMFPDCSIGRFTEQSNAFHVREALEKEGIIHVNFTPAT